MFLRTPYNYDVRAASLECAVDCSYDDDLAKQEFKDETDINTILKRFNVTGQLPTGVRMPTYGDFTGVSDFREALHAIQEAEDSFMAMPAHIRKRFDNDPAQFVDFCSQPENADEARKFGLSVPLAAAPSPVRVEVVNAPASSASPPKEGAVPAP